MTSSISSISFPVKQPDAVVSRPFKLVQRQVTEGGKEKQVIEAWVEFGGAVAQIDTLTITAGSAGDDYIIEAGDGTNSAIVSYTQQSGDTAATIVARILEEINGVASISRIVSATASGNVITLTSDFPGRTVTYDVSGSTTPGNLVIAQTTAASGVEGMGKIAEIKIHYEIPTGSRNLSVITKTTFFDGANPAVITRENNEVRSSHPVSMEAIAEALNA